MTSARNLSVSPLRLAVLAIAPGSFCFGAPASADTRMGVDVAAGGSVESNPYLSRNSSADASGSLQIDPWLTVSDDVSSVDIRGNLNLQRYTQRSNGTDISGTANLATSRRLSPYVSLSGGLNYITTLNGTNLTFVGISPTDPPPPPTTPLPDITLGGGRIRTQSLAGNLGMSLRLSPLDQVGASFTASRFASNSGSGRDYKYLNGGLNYSRTLSERTSLLASVRYARSNYDGTAVGDGTIITPEIGMRRTLSPSMTLSVSLGASFTRSKRADGTIEKFTSLSGDARICRNQETAAICLVAGRSAQPTSLGGISAVTNIALNYNKRVSRRDTVTFGLGFNGTNSSDDSLTRGLETSKSYFASGTWAREFDRRLSAFVSPSYSRIMNSSNSYNSFRLSAGVRYKFGAIS
jgi:hypothetical protein